MTNQNEARGIIAFKSAQLEDQLRKAGATGIGLKELSESVCQLFGDADIARIRRVYELRNKALHEHDYFIDQKVLDRYVANVDSVIHVLEPSPGTEAYFRNKLAESDYVDEETYQWMSEKGQQWIADRQAQKAEATTARLKQATAEPLTELTAESELTAEELRRRRFEELGKRQLAGEMVLKGAAKAGLSPQTKEKLRDGAITVGIHLLGSIFRR
ncbi:hypothetical protein CYD26_24410 [Pseudomonas sp. FFUP_PS_473]|uniref:hypothetical protein n=1 Tax=Pseudomonas sp. FFUP_PS_473 TaxID=2060418 RepID=UPI000C7CF785|nr:hypothetical protein [Pseudomonas sp. FFUP_PS_473]PLP85859.1 hypothetical protein CYD26_24410 [Pseudomonas sp. FFUP_PS_473]